MSLLEGKMGLKHSGQKGFSLVEVMISLAIFLIASMGLMSLLLTGMRVGQRNVLHGEARGLAGEAMTILQTADYDTLPAFDGLLSGAGTIQLLRTVESDLPESGQTRLTVTASWQRAGQEHHYQLQTIRSRP
jgi:prepilin-type N-terminal cleavage/methylation domain-containing protein